MITVGSMVFGAPSGPERLSGPGRPFHGQNHFPIVVETVNAERRHSMDEKVTLGGVEFVVPPLSARRIIRFSKIVVGLGTLNTGSMSEEQMQSVYDALLIGLQQAKPEMTIDDLMDMPVTMIAAIDAVKIVAKQAGLDFEQKAHPQQPAEEEAASLTPPASSVNGTGSLQRS